MTNSKKRTTKDFMTKTYSMPLTLIKRIDDYSAETSLSKSAVVQIAVRQYLDSQKLMETMPQMLQEMKRIVEDQKNA